MPRKKSRTTSKKNVRAKSPAKKNSAIRSIQKSETLIAREQDRLAKQYNKFLRVAEKDVSKLTAQLDKFHRSNKPNAKPVRGRKLSKSAVKTLETQLASAQTDRDFLKEAHNKFLAQQKAISLFLKEWKNQAGTSRKTKSKKSSPAKVDGMSSESATLEQPEFETAS